MMDNEPDQIDMMDEQELRRELRKVVGLYLDMEATLKHRHDNNELQSHEHPKPQPTQA